MNEHHIKTLRIENFKSIKEMDLECSRINVFVGKPNVGKSNILEALGMYGLGFNSLDSKTFLSDIVRYEELQDIFHFENSDKPMTVSSNLGHLRAFLKNPDCLTFFYGKDDEMLNWQNGNIDSFYDNENAAHFNVISNAKDAHRDEAISALSKLKLVRKYTFAQLNGTQKANGFSLIPPYGKNLVSVIKTNKALREEIGQAIKAHELEFVINMSHDEVKIQRKVIDGMTYTLPYRLTASTFQRMIFHYAAVLSNKNSVLLFEEPESHAYPPYVSDLAYKIIDSETNQFFITTHSPYILTTLMENVPMEDLSIFVITYKDYKSRVHKLNDQDFSDIFNNGVDLFFNLRWFDDDA